MFDLKFQQKNYWTAKKKTDLFTDKNVGYAVNYMKKNESHCFFVIILIRIIIIIKKSSFLFL